MGLDKTTEKPTGSLVRWTKPGFICATLHVKQSSELNVGGLLERQLDDPSKISNNIKP